MGTPTTTTSGTTATKIRFIGYVCAAEFLFTCVFACRVLLLTRQHGSIRGKSQPRTTNLLYHVCFTIFPETNLGHLTVIVAH